MYNPDECDKERQTPSLEMFSADECDYARYALCDILGRSRGRVVPVREFTSSRSRECMYGGLVCFTASEHEVSVESTRINCLQQERAVLHPDPNTLHSAPWAGGVKFKVMDVICEGRWISDMTPQLACPRYVARQLMERLSCQGYEILSGFEMEFIIKGSTDSFKGYRYMSHGIHSRYGPVLFNIESMMYRAGVQIESLHSEHDPSLFEMVLKAQLGLAAADAAFVFQSGIQEMEHDGDLKVSFQSWNDGAIVGKHLNHSLWFNGQNIFESSKKELSGIGQHWLAGLMYHARALTAIYNPTANCYKRLHEPSFQEGIYWGKLDRRACIKLKKSPSGSGTYLENRMPSGLSNPYLVLAATVAAGLDGVQRKLTCPPAGRDNIVGKLPGSLSEAVEELVADRVLVEALGREFVQCFVATVTNT